MGISYTKHVPEVTTQKRKISEYEIRRLERERVRELNADVKDVRMHEQLLAQRHKNGNYSMHTEYGGFGYGEHESYAVVATGPDEPDLEP